MVSYTIAVLWPQHSLGVSHTKEKGSERESTDHTNSH